MHAPEPAPAGTAGGEVLQLDSRGAAADAGPGDVADRDYTVLRWLVLATFIVILNETIMVNAVPRLMVELDITARAAQWLSTSFMLTMAVVIPMTGWFLQRVTTRTAFATAMVTFCVGTLLAALAPTFAVLLLARVVQAAGTAVMTPLLMTTLMSVVHESDRGRVMGNVTLAMSVAPALGPAVSGLILSLGSWRWMFGAVLPVAVLISVVSMRNLRNVGDRSDSPMDWPSVLLAVAGFGPLVYGLSQLGGESPAVPPVLTIALGAGGVVAFVLRQLQLQRRDTPFLDLRTLRTRVFTLAALMMCMGFMALIGAMILLPLYLQDVRGLSELQTGLLLIPGGLAMGLLGPSVGRVFDKVGGRPLVIPGAVSMLVALLLLTQVDDRTSVWLVLGAHLLLMVGLAAVFTPAFTLGLGALPHRLYSHGSSVLGTTQQVAAAAGTAVLIAVMSSRAATLSDEGASDVAAAVGGTQWAFTVTAGMAVVVLVLAVILPGRAPSDDPVE